jgi:hypothetical protein
MREASRFLSPSSTSRDASHEDGYASRILRRKDIIINADIVPVVAILRICQPCAYKSILLTPLSAIPVFRCHETMH